jgi:hypothetical protein
LVAVQADAPDDASTRAFVLVRGFAYVRHWARAARAERALRAELDACGLAERLPLLRVEVAASGSAWVELGPVSTDTAELLAGLLARAHRIPDQREADRHRDPHRAA